MKIGTVGTGTIVDRFADAVSEINGMEITAVYSRDGEKAAEYKERYKAEVSFSDRNEFLTSDSFDCLYVASPNSLHYEWAKDGLIAGKNVICEKPFTATYRQAAELVKLAKEKELFLFEAIMPVHTPNYLWLKENLKRIGKTKSAELSYCQYSSRYESFLRGEKPNVFTTEYCGGALMDINYYNLYFVLGLFGEPDNITYSPNIQNGIDVSGVATAFYPSFTAELTGTKDKNGDNYARIEGENGYALVTAPSRCTETEIWVNGEKIACPLQMLDNQMIYELRDFAIIVKENNYTERDRLLGLSLMAVREAEKARKSAGLIFSCD